MNVYFDESRNTGEIGINGNQLNYFEQRYFILVGYIDDEKLTDEYKDFKNKYLNVIYPNLNATEIKGSDLLTKANNKILDDFVKKFFKSKNLLVTIYDKKFFIVTSLLVWLLGIPFKDEDPKKFYTFCEFLIKVDDLFLVNFLYTSNNNTFNNIEKFLEFVVFYNYDECISVPIEKDIKDEFISYVNGFKKNGHEYIRMLNEDVILESVTLKGKKRNNIVNLTALGETVLLLKLTRNLKNKEVNIYHDNIEMIEEYIEHYLTQVSLKFIDSKTQLQIQIADNVSSVIGKFINNILPILSDRDIKKTLSDESLWIRTRLSKIFSLLSLTNIKMVLHLREQAFLMSYCYTTISDLSEFKDKIKANIDLRFLEELMNHMKARQTQTLFNR